MLQKEQNENEWENENEYEKIFFLIQYIYIYEKKRVMASECYFILFSYNITYVQTTLLNICIRFYIHLVVVDSFIYIYDIMNVKKKIHYPIK